MKQNLLRSRAFVVGGVAAGAGSAFALDPATALEAVGQLTTSSVGFGPVMYGVAIATVAILVGVKWIKRGKSAA